MNLELPIIESVINCLKQHFQTDINAQKISLQATPREFEGELTLVVFPFVKIAKCKPEELAQKIGDFLLENCPMISKFNIVKGFLNLSISPKIWTKTLMQIAENQDFGQATPKNIKVMVEYSSPNTNKPLHLGHLRNNFLGFSVSNILQKAGFEVMKSNIVNDRGIHICKSMLAYKKFGKNETPQSVGKKGDHLVGDYYVIFDKAYKQEIQELLPTYQREFPNEELEKLMEKVEKNTPLMLEAQEMLRKWEQNDPETIELWKKMNGWVYEGFAQTYQQMGVSFDKIYYESETYLLGKKTVEQGLKDGIFFKKENQSVWVDLTNDGLDQKLLLRSDGTSVYITQDLGLADLKFQDFPMQQSVYVVGNEQDYHFKVLKLVMQKLGRSYANGIFHLSYGMVELPSGKMKSREGTVVDADDLMAEMIDIARQRTFELGKTDGFSAEDSEKLYKMLALGALKYYLLKVDPQKKMMFNPEDSIDFQGDTGVYVQFAHAKIAAIVRRAEMLEIPYDSNAFENVNSLANVEIEIIRHLANFPERIETAASRYDPSSLVAYVYELAKIYSRFYAELSVFQEENVAKRSLRIALSKQAGRVIALSMNLLGIDVPEKM
ncbi:MAG: arginine--tRNA ligase [Bacteroidetes bacterium]|nr:MAG: arginine--tRNA ligase [Bacteroidota bacterium]